jgi:nicotinamidase/pyrazinamidase
MQKILVVIDMQNDFIDGSLGTKEAQNIVPKVAEKIAQYKSSNVIATRDTHEENFLETQEGTYLPVKHCIRGTRGWEFPQSLKALLAEAKVYDKPSFGSVQLAGDLSESNKREPVELELVGLCTDICVVSNALLLKAYMPEVKISVDASCCAGVTPEKHDAALETMRSCQIQVYNT